MTNREKLDQLLNAISYLENDRVKLNSKTDSRLDATRTSALEILAAGALALREQIRIDNAMLIVNQLKGQGVI
jgi:hypothetical protein